MQIIFLINLLDEGQKIIDTVLDLCPRLYNDVYSMMPVHLSDLHPLLIVGKFSADVEPSPPLGTKPNFFIFYN